MEVAVVILILALLAGVVGTVKDDAGFQVVMYVLMFMAFVIALFSGARC